MKVLIEFREATKVDDVIHVTAIGGDEDFLLPKLKMSEVVDMIAAAFLWNFVQIECGFTWSVIDVSQGTGINGALDGRTEMN